MVDCTNRIESTLNLTLSRSLSENCRSSSAAAVVLLNLAENFAEVVTEIAWAVASFSAAVSVIKSAQLAPVPVTASSWVAVILVHLSPVASTAEVIVRD